jgi:hypothetical protein
MKKGDLIECAHIGRIKGVSDPKSIFKWLIGTWRFYSKGRQKRVEVRIDNKAGGLINPYLNSGFSRGSGKVAVIVIWG